MTAAAAITNDEYAPAFTLMTAPMLNSAVIHQPRFQTSFSVPWILEARVAADLLCVKRKRGGYAGTRCIVLRTIAPLLRLWMRIERPLIRALMTTAAHDLEL
jgi:hypothetical protein